ncbi:hypothetical protein [Nitrosopumilus sp.]|nr:hypothetical protein [Nitrosopumilus sp.]MCV0409828.1 hypothetical protein [Nitrosopumilus sp.]
MDYSNPNIEEDGVESRFDKLYPEYDYSLKSSSKEKDQRKKKRMKTMY